MPIPCSRFPRWPLVKHPVDFGSDEGSALIDLVGFGLLLQIPILLFAISALEAQRQGIALESIARHGLRAFVLGSNFDSTSQVVRQLVTDFELEGLDVSWDIECSPDPSCDSPGTLVRIEVRIENRSAVAAAIKNL